MYLIKTISTTILRNRVICASVKSSGNQWKNRTLTMMMTSLGLRTMLTGKRLNLVSLGTNSRMLILLCTFKYVNGFRVRNHILTNDYNVCLLIANNPILN